MVQFVTDHTGEPLDKNKLRTSILKTNQAREIMDKTYQKIRLMWIQNRIQFKVDWEESRNILKKVKEIKNKKRE